MNTLQSQVLAGDIEEAICTHAVYYSIWRRYSALPERFDWKTKSPNVKFYPLRPELVESTYLLYQVGPAYSTVGTSYSTVCTSYTALCALHTVLYALHTVLYALHTALYVYDSHSVS